tara:strand:- start:487 stop:708 length:222 start_codon:yes stop_codon:yes gene_type:complete
MLFSDRTVSGQNTHSLNLQTSHVLILPYNSHNPNCGNDLQQMTEIIVADIKYSHITKKCNLRFAWYIFNQGAI